MFKVGQDILFVVGQKVWDVVAGEGTVTAISTSRVHPVLVEFTDGAGSSYRSYYTLDGKRHEAHATPSLYHHPVEIIKKVVKPSINWEHVRGEYTFLVQDATGSAWLYIEEPTLDEDYWDAAIGVYVNANSHASFTPGTCDWKDSLVKRPEGDNLA